MKESDIRNVNVLNEYLKLVEKDVKNFFDPGSFVAVKCPACSGGSFTPEFNKIGFQYVSCQKCRTLFVNPRPPFETLNKFYSDSPSTGFWVEKFFNPMAEARREKIFRPRAEYAAKIFANRENIVVGDIGAGFGLFLEELRKIMPANEYIAIEPSTDMSHICSAKGLKVKCMCLEEVSGLDGRFDVLTAFELLEHLYDPAVFLSKAFSLLKPGGHLLMTTLNGLGFDILLLWQLSKSVSPPHHLNFLNPESAQLLLEKTGFEVIETATPGSLDWDIVESRILNDSAPVDRFWKMVADKGTPAAKQELQEWIAGNKFSSHLRVLARKPS